MAHYERRKLYPAEWKRIREDTLQRAGYKCEHCGIAHLSTVYNQKTSLPYIVYLNAAHKSQYRTWDSTAETIALCPACHRRYDRRCIRKRKTGQGVIPLGYARLCVLPDGPEATPLNVDMALTYRDLRDMIDSIPDGMLFVVSLEINQYSVGSGRYRKLAEGVHVIAETEACTQLHALF